ncbi:PTS sugar transporter subunit IIB [Holdemanella sp. SCCA2]|jgi:PTS system mannose-specific IIB component|uniref:PTS system mannose/fructose/N-acetylgalactosamine-transporter subunit IIB n=1 Tax=Holdemanella porci TaxID=2652276 RepID=UPI0029FF056E|nr:PTS sugar transporter subunit IIB [Holdemanella sp. SCCA2]
MSIIVGRVDDRLIHGQVATSWIRGQNIQVVVLVDDKIAANKTQISILKVSAPAGVKLYVQSVDKFVEKYNQGILDPYCVMLVFENVHTPLELVKKGIDLKSVNLGGMRFKEGRRQISKALSVSEDEERVIKELHDLGVEVEHRQLVSDQKVDVLTLL